MKKFLSVLLVFVLLASLVSVAFAAVNGATCPEHDGGEMVKRSIEYGEWYLASDTEEYENGSNGEGWYRHRVYARDVIERLVCTADSSHYETVRYTQTYTEIEFQAYAK